MHSKFLGHSKHRVALQACTYNGICGIRYSSTMPTLSEKTKTIVKATAPVLKEHGLTLTTHFYKRMFSYNPEVKKLFNYANQIHLKQPKALANAVYAYAENIDNLGALGEAVEVMAHKHVALMVKAEHYPIVGSNLLASLKEVLGDAATDDIVQAWGEAYDLLAHILIQREAEIYRKNADAVGGWLGFRNFKIAKKETEAKNIVSFYLEPEDGKAVPDFVAGQYLTVRVASPDGETTMRNYNMTHTPNGKYFRIAVKKIEGTEDTPPGYVSNLLHDKYDVGSVLEIGPPCGEFVLKKSDKPVVFISGGIGITPLYAMLNGLMEDEPNKKVTVIQCCRNAGSQPFADALTQMHKQHPNLNVVSHYTSLDRQIMSSIPNIDAEYYFCGPQPFMSLIYYGLQDWKVPADQIHFHFFGPLQTL